jgi:UDP-glucuronate 4-epimerase
MNMSSTVANGKNNNILITGVAGFIGFSLARELLKHKNKIYGIDNYDNYYSVSYKKKRIGLLKRNKNFFFQKIDISNKKQVKKFFLKKKFNYIFHFAAQAGVRYSLINPSKYYHANILGFQNIVQYSIQSNFKKFFYASSSSVYGEQKKLPVNENTKLLPKNFYGYTKVANEFQAEYYSKIFKKSFIGLRFFTVYGEWGRPDMFIMKILNSYAKNIQFNLNNYGNHFRDFTSIKDVIILLKKLIPIKNKNRHEIYNICSNNPISIRNLVDFFKKKLVKLKIKKIKRNIADVKDTHGSNKKIIKLIGNYKFSNIYNEIQLIILWFFKNKIENLLIENNEKK